MYSLLDRFKQIFINAGSDVAVFVLVWLTENIIAAKHVQRSVTASPSFLATNYAEYVLDNIDAIIRANISHKLSANDNQKCSPYLLKIANLNPNNATAITLPGQ